MDILYGKNPVLEALRSKRKARKLVVADGLRPEDRLEEILRLAEAENIPVESATRRRLNDIAHTEHHQGIAGYFHSREEVSLAELLAQIHGTPMLLVLDGIQDPQNLGALTRTAEAVGVDGIVIPSRRATSMTGAAAKASAGASEHVSLISVGNIVQALQTLREGGFWCVGLAGEGTQRYDEFDYTTPVALVVGAEGEGMRPLTRKNCDAIVSIPMLGKVSSLNAAVAGSILMYEAARQRGFRNH